MIQDWILMMKDLASKRDSISQLGREMNVDPLVLLDKTE